VPFKSEAQRRLFHVKADRGEMSEATVEHWEHATKDKKMLPYHKKHEKKGSEDALEHFGLKEAGIMSGAGKVIGGGMKLLGKGLGFLPTGVGNAAGALVGGAGGAISGAASAPAGQRMRQAGIGAVSGAVGGAIPGAGGFIADPLINAGLNKALPGGAPQAPKMPVMQPNAAQGYQG
jgi:hypothetical protein